MRNERAQWKADISKKIKKIRQESNLSQIEVAKRAGITPVIITQLEAKLHIPSLISAYKIAQSLNISIEELIGKAKQTKKDGTSKEKLFTQEWGILKRISTLDKKLIKKMIERLVHD